MSTWKRPSWRYRLRAVFALALLVQVTGCAFPYQGNEPTFNVPGIGEVFIYYDTFENGFVLKQIDPNTGRYIRIHPGDPRYVLIFPYYQNLQHTPNNSDRASVPGGAGSLPAPAVQ